MTRSRRPNTLLRRARQRRGETQEQLARAVGELLGYPVDPQYISRLERGRVTWPHAHHREALRTHLGVASDAELGFYCRRSAPELLEEDDVKRRAFLAALPLAGVAASEPLGSLVRFAAAEPVPPPRRVGAEHVEQVRAMIAHAQEVNNRFGGGLATETLGGQLRWAVGLLDSHVDPAARADLHSAIGGLAKQAAWSAHDIGAGTAAARYYQVALRCASEADDWPLRAASLTGMARAAEYTGDADTALTLSQEALVRSDRLTPLRRAFSANLEALAHARRGDAEACLAAVGRAEDEFAAADPGNETAAWLAFYSPAELGGEAGRALWPVAMRGQHVDEAARRLRTAADSYSDPHARSRAMCQAQLSALQFAVGDPAEAVSTGTQAINGAGSIQSRRLADHLGMVARAAKKHASVPGVAQLRRQINSALAAV